jgi:molybdate transport system regulatory protein
MTNPGSKLRVRSEIGLEVEGEPVFGQGRQELFHLIQNRSSINAAANTMGIPSLRKGTV